MVSTLVQPWRYWIIKHISIIKSNKSKSIVFNIYPKTYRVLNRFFENHLSLIFHYLKAEENNILFSISRFHVVLMTFKTYFEWFKDLIFCSERKLISRRKMFHVSLYDFILGGLSSTTTRRQCKNDMDEHLPESCVYLFNASCSPIIFAS